MSKHSFYVAGPWADRENVRAIAQQVRDAGYEVTSRWLEVDDVADDDPGREEYLKQQAVHDLEDLIRSDALFYINSMKSEGKATELGIALATMKPIVVVGPREGNIFLHLDLQVFPTAPEAIAWIVEHDSDRVSQ